MSEGKLNKLPDNSNNDERAKLLEQAWEWKKKLPSEVKEKYFGTNTLMTISAMTGKYLILDEDADDEVRRKFHESLSKDDVVLTTPVDGLERNLREQP